MSSRAWTFFPPTTVEAGGGSWTKCVACKQTQKGATTLANSSLLPGEGGRGGGGDGGLWVPKLYRVLYKAWRRGLRGAVGWGRAVFVACEEGGREGRGCTTCGPAGAARSGG